MENDYQIPATVTSKKMSRKLLIVLSILGLILLLCIIVGGIGVFSMSVGGYSIDKVVLTDKVDENGQPIGSKEKFRPSDTIITHVSTTGVQGIIGMRWYHEDKIIFEHFGKTEENQIYTFIQSNNTAILPDGNYRVEIHTTGGTPSEVIKFTVERYMPKVLPPQPTHRRDIKTRNCQLLSKYHLFLMKNG